MQTAFIILTSLGALLLVTAVMLTGAVCLIEQQKAPQFKKRSKCATKRS